MCRIFCLTAKVPIHQAVLLTHEITLRNTADNQPQRDGWGIYIRGAEKFLHQKNAGPYTEASTSWMRSAVSELVDPRQVITHVRAASPNTFKTALEAHPFVFPLEGQNVQLAFVHNGFFHGSLNQYDHTTYDGVEPQSDSFRVALRLRNILLERGSTRINPEIIEEWLSVYDYDSAFAIVLSIEDNIYLFRNSKRDLFISPYGNGFIVNTSELALRRTLDISNYYYATRAEKIEAVPTDTLFTFRYGSDEFQEEKLKINLVYSNYGYQGYQKKTDQPPIPLSNPIGLPPVEIVDIFDEEGADDEITLKEPVQFLTSRDRGLLGEGATASQKKIWKSDIGKLLNPMREPMRSLYACLWAMRRLFPNWSFEEIEDHASGVVEFVPLWYLHLADDDLEEFCAHLEKHPLSKRDRERINKWNHTIPREYEIDIQIALFGSNFYIDVPDDIFNQSMAFAQDLITVQRRSHPSL